MARPRTVTREDVDAVALDLFLDRGFAAVTGQQLATAAGISRPTLYRLVGRIEDVVLDQLDGSLEDLLGAVRLSAGPPWRVLRDAFVGVLEAVEPGSPRAKALTVLQRNPDIRADALRMTRPVRLRLAGVLADRGDYGGDAALCETAAALALALLQMTIARPDATSAMLADAFDAAASVLGSAGE